MSTHLTCTALTISAPNLNRIPFCDQQANVEQKTLQWPALSSAPPWQQKAATKTPLPSVPLQPTARHASAQFQCASPSTKQTNKQTSGGADKTSGKWPTSSSECVRAWGANPPPPTQDALNTSCTLSASMLMLTNVDWRVCLHVQPACQWADVTESYSFNPLLFRTRALICIPCKTTSA